MKNTHFIKICLTTLLCLSFILENSFTVACPIECVNTETGCTVCLQNCQGNYLFSNCSLTSQTSNSSTTAQTAQVYT